MNQLNKKNDLFNESEFSLSIIPVSSKKSPFSTWKKFQQVIAPTAIWHSHYLNQGTVGIIAGKVSGNLECIDVDAKNDPNNTIIDEYTNLIPEDLLRRLVIQTTPNGGLHLIYRCPEVTIEKNQKLALHSNQEVIIETRGEGGYFCTSRFNNEIMQGQFDLINLEVNIPEISKEERDFLLETARSLTRWFPGAETENGLRTTYSEKAINDFNESYPILDLFAKHKWSVVKECKKMIFLLREGSEAPHSGYYFTNTKTFFCFSTSTEFKTEKPYNHFQVLQTLEGKGDYKATLRLLKNYGYSTKETNDKITADDIAEYLNSKGVSYDNFIQDLTLNGKVIEEIQYNTIFIDMKKHFGKEIGRTRFEETIKSNYIQSFNPIKDFVEKYSDRKPQGTFEKWLDCIDLKNKSLERSIVLHFLKKWYVGMIAQALGGEYPNEFFLTLISIEQGIGKTTLLRNYTLPKELHAYRKEHSLSFDDDFKVLMGQALLIIDDEMDGRSYEQDKTFKTVLSTKEITTRRKYDRRISTIKRRCSFAGSGNHLQIIREKLNRRIIPIEIEKIHFEKLAAIDYTDLFMEAYYFFESGFHYSYERKDSELLKALFADYVQVSDVELVLDEYLEKPEAKDDIFHISALDLAATLSEKFPAFSKRINLPTIGKIMAENGYEAIRKGKTRITCYQISKNSRIVTLLPDNAQSWRFILDKQLFIESKNNINQKSNNYGNRIR